MGNSVKKFVWDDKFSLGISILDIQHRRIVDDMNDTYKYLSEGLFHKFAVGHILFTLITNIEDHIDVERQSLSMRGYGVGEYVEINEIFVDELKSFYDEEEHFDLIITADIIDVMVDWCRYHLYDHHKDILKFVS